MNRFRHYLWVALVFLLSGVASGWLWQHERHNAALDRRASLDFSLREITSSIEQRLASYGQVMRGVQSLIAASDAHHSRIQTYVESLQLGADFAGLDEISVIGATSAAPQSRRVVDPASRMAMEAARDSGRLTMTGKVKTTSATANPEKISVEIFFPLYRGGAVPESLADRQSHLLGWVTASVQMGDLMASLYGQQMPLNDIKIHDGVTLSDESLLFNSTPKAGVHDGAVVELTEYLVLAGRTWAVSVRSRPDDSVLSGKDRSNLIAISGTALTLLLSLVTWMLLTGRERAIAQATAMTAELREVKDRFELIFETSPDGVVVSRWADGVIIDINHRFTVLTGFGRDELIGRAIPSLKLWAEAAELRAFVSAIKEQGFCENFEAHFLIKGGKRRVSLISGKQFLMGDVLHLISISRDITDRKEIELRMTHMAQHDFLTGLPNRALFFDRLKQSLFHAKRDKERLALMFLDLDRFKAINDTLGHAVGDLLLKAASLRMMDCVRQSDTVGRIGGDEFVVLLPVIKDDQDALLVALKIRHAIEQPFILPGGYTVNISCSTGIAIYPEHGDDEIALSKSSDAALYRAKDRGRNRVELFYPTPSAE